MKALKSKGDYIGGRFVKAKGSNNKERLIKSPADLKDQVFSFFSDPDHIEPACFLAKKAFPAWAALRQSARNVYLKKLSRVFKAREKEISFLIARETGKPLWESLLEAKALSQKIEITLNKALPLVQDTKLLPLKPGFTKGKIFYRPQGALLALGPFNFPVHLPLGHIVPALALGNTVVFKPSEKTPASGEILSECFHQAGFPKGVFNMLQGGADTAKALLKASEISGVLFTGSYSVGRKIKQELLDHPEKTLTLEMGGKNSALIWKDASMKSALHEVLKGAYLTAGQRCSSTSRLILHKDIKHTFLKSFIALSRKIKVGHYSENPFMGPLIDEKAKLRFLSAGLKAQQQNALMHLKPEILKTQFKGFYVRPAILEPSKYDPKSFYQNEELFCPLVAVYTVETEEEVFHLVKQGGYGLLLSVFCKSRAFAKKALEQARVGVLHWNLSSSGASSLLPFGGKGKSGNARPAGLFTVRQCSDPIAWMEKSGPQKNFLLDKNFFVK